MHMQDLWLEDIHVEQTFVLLNIVSSGVLIWYDTLYNENGGGWFRRARSGAEGISISWILSHMLGDGDGGEPRDPEPCHAV